MSEKKIIGRKRRASRLTRRAKKGAATTRADSGLSRRLQDLREQIDIVLPEVMARVAALEHFLLEKQLCTKDDLRRAREFVRLQET